MSAVYCSQGWRRKERVWEYISMTGFTASLMVLKLVPSMEGFATGSTAKAVGSGEVALAVTDHGLWVGEGLAAERAYRVRATYHAGHATRRHPLGQQSLQHTPTMLVLTTATNNTLCLHHQDTTSRYQIITMRLLIKHLVSTLFPITTSP